MKGNILKSENKSTTKTCDSCRCSFLDCKLAVALVCLLSLITTTLAFRASPTRRTASTTSTLSFTPRPFRTSSTPAFQLKSSSSSSSVSSLPEFSSQERELVDAIQQEAANTSSAGSSAEGTASLRLAIEKYLPQMPPSLILKLRDIASQYSPETEKDTDSTSTLLFDQQLALALNAFIMEQMDQAKQTLQSLLNAGEIRKLDNLIGNAARSNQLNSAFFNVLDANLRDAVTAASTNDKEKADDSSASRLQILQHIYTRCQEEMEKNIPPGVALLNKLLRTEQAPIRKNIYQHYLTPQEAVTIQTPDGKTVELKGQNKKSTKSTLVSLDDFVQAIADAVKQIRTMESAGATSRESAAIMVESCRIVAKEARVIIGESYGIDSSELQVFENGLQPVFRPASPDSVYIKGE